MWQDKISHLFHIVGQLSPYSQVTVDSLAREYNMSKSKVEKDVEIILSAGLGVFVEDDKIRITRHGYKRIRSWLLS